jgi:hypothetical protein
MHRKIVNGRVEIRRNQNQSFVAQKIKGKNICPTVQPICCFIEIEARSSLQDIIKKLDT